MTSDLTEEDMRRALFGAVVPASPSDVAVAHEPESEVVFTKPPTPATKKKTSKAFTPRLRVTLRVGNEFEGKTFELIHEADTLSALQAELEATRVAGKKFRYVEVISVKPRI